jgi:hypothetical protein
MSKVLGIMLSNTVSQYYEDMTNKAIDTALEYKGSHDLHIAVVETNSNFVGYFKHNVSLIKPCRPFNYNQFINIGYDYMVNDSSESFMDYEPDYVMIMNNDLVFHGNWLENLIEGLESGGFDSVSPRSPGWQFHTSYVDGGVYEGWGIGYSYAGWAVLYKADSFAKLQPFDEQYVFFCQDNSVIDDMQKMNMRHALIANSLVTHLANQSHRTVDYATFKHYTDGMVELYNSNKAKENDI